jgi:uncharacterized membrane protein
VPVRLLIELWRLLTGRRAQRGPTFWLLTGVGLVTISAALLVWYAPDTTFETVVVYSVFGLGALSLVVAILAAKRVGTWRVQKEPKSASDDWLAPLG